MVKVHKLLFVPHKIIKGYGAIYGIPSLFCCKTLQAILFPYEYGLLFILPNSNIFDYDFMILISQFEVDCNQQYFKTIVKPNRGYISTY